MALVKTTSLAAEAPAPPGVPTPAAAARRWQDRARSRRQKAAARIAATEERAAGEASEGAPTLAILQQPSHIDGLITDMGRPRGLSGRQLADAARLAHHGLKVHVIARYAENAVLGRGHLEAGMHVVTKPFSMEQLATRIEALIRDAERPGGTWSRRYARPRSRPPARHRRRRRPRRPAGDAKGGRRGAEPFAERINGLGRFVGVAASAPPN